jgi:hypothetical protein
MEVEMSNVAELNHLINVRKNYTAALADKTIPPEEKRVIESDMRDLQQLINATEKMIAPPVLAAKKKEGDVAMTGRLAAEAGIPGVTQIGALTSGVGNWIGDQVADLAGKSAVAPRPPLEGLAMSIADQSENASQSLREAREEHPYIDTGLNLLSMIKGPMGLMAKGTSKLAGKVLPRLAPAIEGGVMGGAASTARAGAEGRPGIEVAKAGGIGTVAGTVGGGITGKGWGGVAAGPVSGAASDRVATKLSTGEFFPAGEEKGLTGLPASMEQAMALGLGFPALGMAGRRHTRKVLDKRKLTGQDAQAIKDANGELTMGGAKVPGIDPEDDFQLAKTIAKAADDTIQPLQKASEDSSLTFRKEEAMLADSPAGKAEVPPEHIEELQAYFERARKGRQSEKEGGLPGDSATASELAEWETFLKDRETTKQIEAPNIESNSGEPVVWTLNKKEAPKFTAYDLVKFKRQLAEAGSVGKMAGRNEAPFARGVSKVDEILQQVSPELHDFAKREHASLNRFEQANETLGQRRVSRVRQVENSGPDGDSETDVTKTNQRQAERAYAELAANEPTNPSIIGTKGRFDLAGQNFQLIAEAAKQAKAVGAAERMKLQSPRLGVRLSQTTGAPMPTINLGGGYGHALKMRSVPAIEGIQNSRLAPSLLVESVRQGSEEKRKKKAGVTK